MLIQCCASAMQRTLLYFCMEEQKKWAFTLVATTSLLAGTRNLVSRPALCYRGQCADIEKRSLVLARDDVLRALCYILWVCTIFRQKNIRTKDSLNARMFVQSSLTNICSFNVVHLRCCGHYSTFVEKNKRSGCLQLFCFFKNAVLALQILLL